VKARRTWRKSLLAMSWGETAPQLTATNRPFERGVVAVAPMSMFWPFVW
jgi:hypothetical protein